MIWLIVLLGVTYVCYRYLMETPLPDETPQPRKKTILPTVPPQSVPVTGTLSPRDQIVKTVESLNWCNDILKICWPYVGKITESLLGPTVEPLINQELPKPFSNFRFLSRDLGRDPLKVDRITVHRRYHNSVALDLDVAFAGTPNLVMKCSPLAGTFGVKKLSWHGRLTVLLRPLITTMPLVGAVQAAMITHPELDIDFTGVAEVADFGPIARIVRQVMRQVLASMIVLPNRFVFMLSESVDYFDVYYPPMGAMQVTFVQGRGFSKERKVGFIKTVPDIYVKGKFGLEKFKTPVQKNSLTPIWNTSHTFVIYDLDQPLEVKIMDKDTGTRDDLLGEITLHARELLKKERQWVPPHVYVNHKVASKSEILIETILYNFVERSVPLAFGKCMVSVLIDRAKNLPRNTSWAVCRVRVGNHFAKETVAVVRPDEPVPGVDPENPIWITSFDVMCDNPSSADVVLEVFDRKQRLGQVVINHADLCQARMRTKAGEFPIGVNGATLRAKVILHGLVKESLGATKK